MFYIVVYVLFFTFKAVTFLSEGPKCVSALLLCMILCLAWGALRPQQAAALYPLVCPKWCGTAKTDNNKQKHKKKSDRENNRLQTGWHTYKSQRQHPPPICHLLHFVIFFKNRHESRWRIGGWGKEVTEGQRRKRLVRTWLKDIQKWWT